jgi:hypothetical protein
MELEYEYRGIEELLTSENDEYVPVTVTLKDKGEFLAYITPLKYGDLPKDTNLDEYKIGQKILLNHVFNSKKEPFKIQQLNKLPAGWIEEFVFAIKQISGFDEDDKTVRDF